MKITRVTTFSKTLSDDVLRLLPQLSPEAELISEETLKKILSSAGTYFFIGQLENKQIVAMLTIGTYSLLSGDKYWIEDVVVDESQRGKGYGRELMLFAIEYSKSLGAKSLSLTSRPSRIAANKLYTELGFVRYETNMYKFIIES